MKKLFKILSLIFILIWRGNISAQTVISTATTVNSYTSLSANAAKNAKTINVTTSNFVNAGDLILIIQIQGASINQSQTASYGQVTNYNNCGNYEFVRVASVSPSSPTTITLSCQLKNNYSVGANNRTQIVKVPEYTSLDVTASGSITCPDWSSTTSTGGIIALKVSGNITIDGTITASGKGFIGAPSYCITCPNNFLGGTAPGSGFSQYCNDPNTPTIHTYFSMNVTEGAVKGEGIAGALAPPVFAFPNNTQVLQGDFYIMGGQYCRGAPANGGGGGNGLNSGGGGGSNAGTVSNVSGNGVYDKTPAYAQAWAIDGEIIVNSDQSGGGRGGNEYSTAGNPLTDPPGTWNTGGDGINATKGGRGGWALDYSTGRLFLGGGGGGGGQNNIIPQTQGGNGGGLIYILCDGTITGSGKIVSDGADGGNAFSPSANGDAANGAGGGGTIVLNSTGGVSGITVTAKGGKGGDQNGDVDPNGAFGPGGGGGGGYVAFNGSIIPDVSGGKNGNVINNSSPFALKFPPKGATNGNIGTIKNSVSALIYSCGLTATLSASKPTICKGDSSVLTLTIGSPTGNVTYAWSNGLGSGIGPVQVKPIITTTYSVTVTDQSPATVIATVAITVSSPPTVSLTGGSICAKDSINLVPSGATNYTWDNNLGTGTSKYVKPTITTTYNVTGTTSGCSNTAQATVTVNPRPTITISGDTSICPGSSTTLTANSVGAYKWSDNITTTSTFSVTPANTQAYTVTVINNGCSATAKQTIYVTGALTPIIKTPNNNPSVCKGDSIQLSTSGGKKYIWNTAGKDTTAVITTQALQVQTTYTVSVYGSNVACSGTASIIITINPLPTAGINGAGVCNGQQALLTATGGNNYSWNTAELTSSITVKPTNQTTYYVTAYLNPSRCTDSTHFVVNVSANPIPSIAASNQRICSGSNSTLTVFASDGIKYSWSNQATSPVITVSPTVTTIFTVTITNAAPCTATDSTIITVMPPPDNPAVSPIYLCTNNPIQDVTLSIGNQNFNDVYRWYDTIGKLVFQGTTLNVKQVTKSQKYLLETISSDSCHSSSKETVNIYMNKPPVASFNYIPKPIVMQYTPVAFENLSSSDATIFLWNFGENQSSSNEKYPPTYAYSDTGLFTITLTAKNNFQCQSDTSINIYIKRRLTIWLPIAFTPNNDGKNDIFYIRGPVKTMKLEIYNQWGFKVFTSENQSDGWDGKFQGIEQPIGNYIWTLNATSTDDQQVILQGELTLVR